MLSVTYPIAVETTFDEYTKLLFRQGGMENTYVNCSPQMHLHVVEKVLEQADAAFKSKNYDLAYVKFTRVIHIIDEEQLRERLKNGDGVKARSALKVALDSEKTIRTSFLTLLLEQQNRELAEAASERQRIIALQMEEHDDSDDNVDEAKRHNERRLQLLNATEPRALPFSPKTQVAAEDTSEEFYRQRQIRLAELGAARELALQAKLLQHPVCVPPNVPPVGSHEVDSKRHTSVLSRTPHCDQPAPIQSSLNTSAPKMHDKVNLQVSQPRVIRPWKFESSALTSSVQARRGLINLGNTCYMNSVLQCLAQTELGFYVTSGEFCREVVDQNKGSMIQAFAFLMREMQINIPQPVNASRLKFEVAKTNDLFAGKSQQDASEFLRALLDGMHEEVNAQSGTALKQAEIDNAVGDDIIIAKQYWEQYKQRNSSLIVSMFAFQERSSLLCPSCGNNPRTFHPVMGVEVPIPELKRDVCVEDCLAAYCKKEILDSESLYNCGACKKKVPASKQLSFHTLPRSLVLTLKRFRSYGNFSDKVTTQVAFQSALDMKPFLSNTVWKTSTRYKLIGIVNHQGNIHGGHYTADVMGMRDGLWYSFSDEVVREATEPNFKLAYTLFYLLID